MPISYKLVWNESKNIVFTCFQQPNMTPQNALGPSPKYSKQKVKMIEKVVRGGDQTAPFRGVWRVLGGCPLLGRFWCRSRPLSWEPPGRLLGLFFIFWPPSWPLKTHLEAREKMIKNRCSSRSPWEPFRWAFYSVQGAKMEASWLQNSIPLGPCLKNGVNLRNTTIPILKIRFWRVQGHAFSVNFGYFFDLC